MSIKYKNRKYEIVSYDPKWKDKFAEEAKVLNSIFGMSAIKIEHVGSTAVPGLSGKPIIDVLILVEDVAIADALNQKMESAGFKALGEYVMPGVRLFVKEMDNILVLEGGRLIESGNFEELMAKKGRFFELWEKQKL